MKKNSSKIVSKNNKETKRGKSKQKVNIVLIVVVALVALLSIFLLTKKSKKVVNPDSIISTEPVELFDFDANYKDRKVVVAYFSATGKTKAVAEKIANIFMCDAVEIEPVEPYSEFDLTSQDPSTRPMREKAFDPLNPPEEPEEDESTTTEDKISPITSLPEIKKISFNRYDTIILGYPIWYGDAPRVIYTFVSENNLNDKVIIPFCTSDNDEIDLSVNSLAAYAGDNANFMSGKRFTKDSTEEEIKDFFTSISPDLDYYK